MFLVFLFSFAFLLYFFHITPHNFAVSGRKRTRVSHSNSTELAQMAFNNDTLLTNTPLTSMPPSNTDSAEMAKEIKRILDEKYSSTEFREIVERIDIDGKYPFMRIKRFI